MKQKRQKEQDLYQQKKEQQEKDLKDQTISTLESKIKDQEALIAQLYKKVESADSNVKEIVMKAIENSGTNFREQKPFAENKTAHDSGSQS